MGEIEGLFLAVLDGDPGSATRPDRQPRTVGSLQLSRAHMGAGALTLAAVGDEREARVAMLLVRDGWVGIADPSTPQSVQRVLPGQTAYFVDGRAYLLTWEEASGIAVGTSERSINSFGVRIDDERCRLGRSALFDPTVALLESIIDLGDLNVAAEYMLGRLAEEAVGGLFLDAEGVDHELTDSDSALYQQAGALIATRRSDADFDARALADALSTSMSRLRRVFRERGATVGGELRRQRLELALTLLTDDVYAPLGVGDIAAYAGFADADSLRRALRGAGLASPSEIRGAAIAARSASQ